jgi:nucleoid-associated protein YgaU
VRGSRILVAVGVLAVGLCAALPFRQPPPPAMRAPSRLSSVDLTLRISDVTLQASPTEDRSPAVDLESASAAVRRSEGVVAIPIAVQQSVRLDNLAPPPDLPVSFEPQGEALTPAVPSSVAEADSSGPVRAAAKRANRPRSYRLRDGDTLESLAERFLGTRQRAGEILEANRAKLLRPDLLPVGTTITIPPRSAAKDGQPPGREF